MILAAGRVQVTPFPTLSCRKTLTEHGPGTKLRRSGSDGLQQITLARLRLIASKNRNARQGL